MQGFDPEFNDLPDYIEKITERIWEGRGIGLIRRWYAEDCLIHTSMGPLKGVAAIVAGTFDTLNAFPDRRLLPEDVIWSGDAERGFLSSHRILSPATHLGTSHLGPPTGLEVQFRAIADCLCRENRVQEEWLARDLAGIAAQIGLDPDALARTFAEREAATGTEPWHLGAARTLREEGALRPAQWQDHPAAALVRGALEAIWGRAELHRIRELYHPAAIVHAPGAATLAGHERLSRWLFGLFSAFPDAKFVVEHSIANGDERRARVSTRWWLTGTHSGHGRFGPPSDATILLLGMAHSDVVEGQVRQEWVIADEIAVRKQIALKRG
jgi:predicted ester cyclase